jgi:uncharacterized repeat protein (TIGR03803 family)
MSKVIVWGTRAYAVLVLCAITAIALPAQTLTTLFSFDGTDGQYPSAELVQGPDGNFYGTTTRGGAHPGPYGYGGGTIFKIAPSGKLTPLYSFCPQSACPDGYGPNGLILASDGNFYGTTFYGANPGPYDLGSGTVFKITPSGAFTTIYTFCSQSGCADGANPAGELVQGTDGDLYGTTLYGGVNLIGTVFKITLNGALTTLSSSFGPGELPEAGLVQAANGDFYGTAFDPEFGYVFEITPGGTLTTLFSFPSDGADGGNPAAGLVQGPGGYLYGTTSTSSGSVFKMTPRGSLTSLYTFCSQSGCTDGQGPAGALVAATDGNLYGNVWGRRDKLPRNGLRNHPERHADDTIQLLLRKLQYGRRGPLWVAPGHQRRLLRCNVPWRGPQRWHRLQPVRRPRPIRENSAPQRPGRRGHPHPGQRPDRRHSRHLQRRAGRFRHRRGHRNQGHRTSWCDHRQDPGEHTRRHAPKRRPLHRAALISSSSR